jgi:hypothetical protein
VVPQASTEIELLKDIDGDGKPEVLFGGDGAMNYANPDSVPPRYSNWNLSIQRSLTSSMVLTAAYVGGLGESLAGAAPGKWTNQADPKYLALGTLLNSTANPANVAAAAAIIPGIALPFPTYSRASVKCSRSPVCECWGTYNNDDISYEHSSCLFSGVLPGWHTFQILFHEVLARSMDFRRRIGRSDISL